MPQQNQHKFKIPIDRDPWLADDEIQETRQTEINTQDKVNGVKLDPYGYPYPPHM